MSIDWKLLCEAREDVIVKLEKRLADASLVEAELRAVLQDLSDDAILALLNTGEKK